MKRALLGMVLALSAWGSAHAAVHIPWNGAPYFIATRGAKVAEVLKSMGANYGIPVIVSPEVEDYFVGTIRNTQPDLILERFVQLFNLATYYDGQALYIYKTQEAKSQIITPKYLTTRKLVDYLKHSNAVEQPYCALKMVTNFNALEIFGVPMCINRISELAKNLDEKIMNQAQNQETVRVFRLNFASASDHSYTYRNDQKVNVPGMVTVLREMVRSQSPDGEGTPVGAGQVTGGGVITTTAVPSFSADSQQNAVVIRDREVNMPIYEKLIAQLDQPSTQIEISVAIIDVNASDINQLGVDWAGQLNVGPGSIGFNSGGAANFNTVLGDASNFMVQINALEQHAKAKVLSRPSVVTLNNVQAVLDRNITLRTKLVGEKVASVDKFSTGSLLRVTPRLIKRDGLDQILLVLNIQDGQEERNYNANNSADTDILPSIRNAEISTQATLLPGQSLLLGGFVQDSQSDNERKIPLFGDIPVLGHLFQSKQSHTNRVVRLFLIKAVPLQTMVAK